jgi:membrane fusion protein (multidrug efflux system)
MTMIANSFFRIGCALALASLSACQTAETAGKGKPLEVHFVEVKPEDVIIYTDFVGTVDGVENAEIRARVAGYLEAVHFQEGQHVKKGDLLFTIDPVLSEAELRRAEGDLAMARAAESKAKSDVDRLAPLVATNAVSKQELDHAVSAQQSAQAQIVAAQGVVATAKASLDFTHVRSPIDGVIGVREVSIGTLVGQGEPTLLTTVSKLDHVRVRFPISERLYLKHAATLSRLIDGTTKAGRNLELVLADGSTYAERGWLELIDRAVSTSTGSILLEARFPNDKGLLRPGQFGRVRAATARVKGATGVPQRAVLERQSMSEVFVVGEGNKVERRAVVPGERVGQFWLIEKGLAPGDKVLVDGIQKVTSGTVVTPMVSDFGPISPPRPGTTPEVAKDPAPDAAPAPAEAEAAKDSSPKNPVAPVPGKKPAAPSTPQGVTSTPTSPSGAK